MTKVIFKFPAHREKLMKRQIGEKLMTKPKFYATLLVATFSLSTIFAKGAGTSGGLTLIETSAARPSALGEAFTSAENDVSAFTYNPANLDTLESGHTSFMYQEGLAEDAFGQFLIGAPTRFGGLGLSVGFYDGGEIDLFDGETEQTVKAQRDLSLGLGYSNRMGPVSLGMTGKYLSSELIESEKASAFAADFGMSMPLMSNMRMGAALQNIGTQLKFVEEGDDLPRIARVGASMNFPVGRMSSLLLLDAPYFLNEAEIRPSVGLEMSYGVLSLRGGYKGGGDSDEFSLGTGFMFGRASLDYAYGLVQDLDSQHRVSLAMRFGSGRETPVSFVKKQEIKKKENKVDPAWTVVEETQETKEAPSRKHTLGDVTAQRNYERKKKSVRQVYTIKPGDSLRKIARRHYGSGAMWQEIYRANKHLLDDPRNIVVGQRILLP